jgi:hypothetical protein
LDVGNRLSGSIYDESRCTDEISIPESWRVRAGGGVGYAILEADDEDKETADEGEDSCKLLVVPTPLLDRAPYDKSG